MHTEIAATPEGATNASRYLRSSAVLIPAAVAPHTCASQSFSFPDVQGGDVLIGMNKPSEQPGLSVSPGHVAASGSVTLNFCNATASTIRPAPGERYHVV